ncbi:hypothetical protein [Saccharopolyspora pogona]|uniref:hypothetical protein n=1 Tax=Saccharopolyspora pogona TaxID=333966 RepID=UPI001682611B|nr:hypothetical protein [Saccharopolyspora pogona]
MTGPEHYQQAEMILTQVKNGHTPDGTPISNAAEFLARAQVHATLAQAAGAALAAMVADPGSGDVFNATTDEWHRVMGERAW